jgi:hypothetical protein
MAAEREYVSRGKPIYEPTLRDYGQNMVGVREDAPARYRGFVV